MDEQIDVWLLLTPQYSTSLTWHFNYLCLPLFIIWNSFRERTWDLLHPCLTDCLAESLSISLQNEWICEWMNETTSQTYLGHWLSPLACCLFYKSDISLPLKGNDRNIPQSKGIAGDKTRVLSSKAYSRVCVYVCMCLKGAYKQDMQKINEIILGTDKPLRRVPWTWDKKWVSQ